MPANAAEAGDSAGRAAKALAARSLNKKLHWRAIALLARLFSIVIS
jgi:hypothetical protein